MSDYTMTVKGLHTLAAMYRAEAGAMWESNKVWGAEDWKEYERLQKAAARCSRKAFEMLGIVTLDAAQMPLMTTEGEVVL